MSWCTIESDPGVFSEMIAELGVPAVSVEEIYSLEEAEQQREPSYGLIFLFKWVQESDPRVCVDPRAVPELFFARQTIPNACATQAILSVLLNAEGVDIGASLSEFKSFAVALDSESRGFAIGGSDRIRAVHNSFARSEPFVAEESKSKRGKREDAYHFVAYVPFQGRVYEIDGLKEGPILLGEAGSDWLLVARPAIEQRMQRYASSETAFALMTLRPRRAALLQGEISSLEERLAELSLVEEEDEDVQQAKQEMRERLEELRTRLAYELANVERQRQENVRRRHNYLPFIATLLKHLSAKNLLQPMIDSAVQRQQNTHNATKQQLKF